MHQNELPPMSFNNVCVGFFHQMYEVSLANCFLKSNLCSITILSLL